MTITQEFIQKLQNVTGNEILPKKFWRGSVSSSAIPTFKDFLDKYAEYYNSLPTIQQKEYVSKIFWEHVKAKGTPIIEDHPGSDAECDVYFLFPKEALKKPDIALMSVSPLNTMVMTLDKPSYILSPEGLYYISDINKHISKDDLIEKDPKKVKELWEKIGGNENPGDHLAEAITLENQEIITSITSHTPNDLYLQGDFHGYGSTDGRQKLLELQDTGIIWHQDRMPRDALVVYSYIQVESRYRGIKPVPEHSPFFNDGEGFTPHYTETNFPSISQTACNDENSTHSFPYGFPSSERVFRVSADSKHAHIQTKPIDWVSLLKTEMLGDARNFIFHSRWYSNIEGNLQSSKEKLTPQYHDDLNYSDQPGSAYANFTRSIHVFKPASGKIDDIIVINDGMPYLITGIMDYFEKMVSKNKLSPNTALVFVNPLPGLKTTLSPEEAATFNQDPSASLPGMGIRLIDYKHGVDKYIDFIANKLFPQLKKEINVPDHPNHRVMIGSSLSGTASIYIGSKRPDLFGAVIAQSPSPDNRAILGKIPRATLKERNIHLSCGQFEHPDYAAANANIEYAEELSHKLDVPLHTGKHGHQFVAWNEELERSWPVAYSFDAMKSIKHAAEFQSRVDRYSSTARLIARHNFLHDPSYSLNEPNNFSSNGSSSLEEKNTHIFNFSEYASFSINDSDRDTHKKIKFFYNDLNKAYEKSGLMLVIFPGIEKPMQYDENKHQWFVETEVLNNARDFFIIIPAKPEDDLEVKQTISPVLDDRLLITNGKPHPYIYADPSIPKGTLKKMLYRGDGSLGEEIPEDQLKIDERLITIYFPPRYDFNHPENNPSYNLQITLDGKQYLERMHMNTTLDNLIAAEEIEPVITVFISPYCGPPDFQKKGLGDVCPPGYSIEDRFKEYSCNPEFADKLAALPETLRKQQINVTDNPNHTTIWGFSMGGLQAVYTALLHPTVFGNIVGQSPMAFNIPERNIILLPEGRDPSKTPIDEFSKDAVLIKLVKGQLTAYQVINDEIQLVKKIELDQLRTSEISSYFPKYDKNKIITPSNTRDVFDKFVSIIGEDLIEQAGNHWRNHITDDWRTSTARLPSTEYHNEYLTQMLSSGEDIISNRLLSPSRTLKFYFSAGSDEEKYEPEAGTANLVVATEIFANNLREKGYSVAEHNVDQESRLVRVVTPGAHDPITCMEVSPDALKIMNPPRSLEHEYSITTRRAL